MVTAPPGAIFRRLALAFWAMCFPMVAVTNAVPFWRAVLMLAIGTGLVIALVPEDAGR